MGITVTQRFRRTIVQPADGTDFFVDLPDAEPDGHYSVFAEQISGASILPPPLLCDETPGLDRTALHFRVITSDPGYANGDVLEFVIVRST